MTMRQVGTSKPCSGFAWEKRVCLALAAISKPLLHPRRALSAPRSPAANELACGSQLPTEVLGVRTFSKLPEISGVSGSRASTRAC
jgi:hypothetical protein